ncbi:MAG TPA: bifunctional DNA primase/polymerase [Acidimicrobiia bacterium]
MELLIAAFAYLGLGWSVVPVHTPGDGRCSCREPECPSPGKHPRVRWQEYAEHAATVEEVRDWWRRWPAANVGVVAGGVSGVVVIDVDPRSGGDATFESIVAEKPGIPVTVETLTGGGGTHLWFSPGSPPIPATTVLGPGVELKAAGSLVVVPPSIHASGRPYEWKDGRDPWTIEPAPLPGWLAPRHEAGRAEDGHAVRTEGERREFASLWREAGVALEPGDRYYRCPFHEDTHPSLHVDADGCRWFCFGCRRGGAVGMLRRMLGHEGDRRPRGRATGQVGGRRPVSLRGACIVELVGESRCQDELLSLIGGRRPYGGVDVRAVAELIPDPANPYDADAIEVRIDGLRVGYLRHDAAVAHRAEVEDSLDLHGFATCQARIRGGWDRGHGDVGALGVTLELPEAEER